MAGVETRKQPESPHRTGAVVCRATGSSPQTMGAAAPAREGAANCARWGFDAWAVVFP